MRYINFHSITLTLFIAGLAPVSQISVSAQERPDGLKLRSEQIDEALNSLSSDTAEVRSLTTSFRGRRLAGRKLPRRSKRLRNILGKRGRKLSFQYPSADGSGNNVTNPQWGKAVTPFKRLASATYVDGSSKMKQGGALPSARAISNACFDQGDDIPNHYSATDYLWQWGQFLDHDITLTPILEPAERAAISIPTGDMFFDPFHTGAVEMGFSRSAYVMVNGVRQQLNAITAFIDASQVYGSDRARQEELRTLDGTGKLKVSAGDMLPFNVNLFPNDNHGDIDPTFFLAGDIRANEQVGLTTLHTLFVREHNYWAEYLLRAFPRSDGDRIFEMARAIVAGEMQVITYNEYLPFLLGKDAIPPYAGYDDTVDPSITNEFATAAYRVGHSMLSAFIPRVDENQKTTANGHLLLRDAFFQPKRLLQEGGIDPVLRGLASRRSQSIDNFLIDDVRNFLFGPPGAGGFDLASLNIQRGRDHGLPSFNNVRRSLGLTPAKRFSDITTNSKVSSGLSDIYNGDIESVELWVGGLHEDHKNGAMVGETFQAIMAEQFTRLRDGDRFWYENHLPRRLKRMVRNQTLAKIIRRNTKIKRSEIQDDVFKLRTPFS